MSAAEDFPTWPKVVVAVVAMGLGGLLALYCLPPWWGRWAYMAHAHTGIPSAFGWRPPPHFNGIWQDYYTIGRIDSTYRNGKLDGPILYYDLADRLMYRGEYRDGHPWSGMCNWRNEDHPWYLADYRNGKIWTGAGYYEGRKVTHEEFEELMKRRVPQSEQPAVP